MAIHLDSQPCVLWYGGTDSKAHGQRLGLAETLLEDSGLMLSGRESGFDMGEELCGVMINQVGTLG